MKTSTLFPMVMAFLAGSLSAASVIPIPEHYQPPFWPEGRPLEGLVITVDPGHGGSSFSGGYHGSARGLNSRVVEGDLNMRVSALLFHHLQDAGARVHLTRRDDRKVTLGPTGRAEELGARPAMAEATRSHLFLSLHHNAVGRQSAHGVVILIWPKDKAGNEQPLEVAFADILREEIQAMVPWSEEFGHYQIEHPLVVDSDLPSAVVEYGFLTNPDFDAWVAGPTSHKAEAVATYNAVARMWGEHREALEELRDRVLPPAESATPSPSPLDEVFPLGRPSHLVWSIDRPARSISELQFVMNTWRHALVTDRTTMYTEATITAREGDGGFVATGWTMHPHLGEGLVTQLTRASASEVSSNLRPVPDLAGTESFGVVKIPMALTWGQPREGASVQTQLLHGEPLFLLRRDESGDYYLVMGIDGYVGWVRRDAVGYRTREEFTELLTGSSATVVRNTMRDDFRVPPASRVRVQEVGGDGATILLGNDATMTVPVGNLLLAGDPRPGEIAARTALEEFLYTPYVFGGRSNLGLDCSGLVGAAWAAAGVQLPRDAHQQALVGQLVGTPWYLDGLLPGDVLYFIDRTGRVIHAGLSLGGMEFIHASPPEVQINSLDPASPLYSRTWAEAFITARRPMP